MRFRLSCGAEGSAKPSEVLTALLGAVPERARVARVRLYDAADGDPLAPRAIVPEVVVSAAP